MCTLCLERISILRLTLVKYGIKVLMITNGRLCFVRSLDVFGQVSSLICHVAAFFTLEIEQFRMGEHVFSQIVPHSESTLTNLTKVVLLFRMHGHMDFELRHWSKPSITYLTHTFEHIFVDLFVHVQCRISWELLCTLITLENALFHVNTANVIRDDALTWKVCMTNVAFVLFDLLMKWVDVIFIATRVCKRFITIGTIVVWTIFRRLLAVAIVNCLAFLFRGRAFLWRWLFNRAFAGLFARAFAGLFTRAFWQLRRFLFFRSCFSIFCTIFGMALFDHVVRIKCMIQHMAYQFHSGHVIVAHLTVKYEIIMGILNVIDE